MSTRTILLASASLLAMTSAFVQSASAQCVTTGTITGTCNASVSVTGDLVVGPTGIVNGSSNSWGIRNPIHAAIVTNAGQINALWGITNSYIIDTLTNSGTINGVDKGGVAFLNAPFANIGALIHTGAFNVNVTGASPLSISALIENDGGTITSATIGGTVAIAPAPSRFVPNARVVHNSGSIGSLVTSSTMAIVGSNAVGVYNTRYISTAPYGTITNYTNSGTLDVTGSSVGHGILNEGTFGTFTNTGKLSVRNGVMADSAGISNVATFDTINNESTGTIEALAGFAIYNEGQIKTITNHGVLTGAQVAILNNNAGTITSLTTDGALVSVGVGNVGFGIVNRGNIGTLASNGSYDFAHWQATFIANPGTIGTLTAGGTTSIHNSGASSWAYGISTSGSITELDVTGTIDVAANEAYGVYNGTVGGAGFTGTLNVSGSIQATGPKAGGVQNRGTITNLANSGTISANGTTAIGFENVRNLGTLTNTGVIEAAGPKAIAIQNDYSVGGNGTVIGTITALNNQGRISADVTGIKNDGLTGTLTNSGTISGGATAAGRGIYNTGTITSLENAGTIEGNGATFVYGIHNEAYIATVTNSGTIRGGGGTLSFGMANAFSIYTLRSGSIGTLNNSGVIEASSIAISNGGTITTMNNLAGATISGDATAASVGFYNEGLTKWLTNDGVIETRSVNGSAIENFGEITSLVNNGVVRAEGASGRAIYNGASVVGGQTGRIISLSNSGLIEGGGYAIYSAGYLGWIINYGTITGNIHGGDITFASGSGTSAGELNGGTITANSVTFSSGTMTVKDDFGLLTVASTVRNSGANLFFASASEIFGSYVQASGNLSLAAGKLLDIAGTASLTGGTVTVVADAAANYYVGLSGAVLTAAGGLTYSNLPMLASVAGLEVRASAGATDLSVVVANNYVGGTLASLANSGSLTAENPIYVAATGSLSRLINTGTLTGSDHAIYSAGVLGGIENSGTISGNISSATAFTVAGGTGSTVGVLTGGTITAPGVTFTSGNIALSDAFNLGTGTVTNAGATLTLAEDVTVAGNFAQSGGTIDLATGKKIVVSGNATMTGGSVTTSLSATGNYLATDTGPTLVSAGSGSCSGLTINVGVTGLEAAAASPNDKDLAVGYRNDYVGGMLESVSNSGTIGGSYGLYVAASGNLGSFSNTGTVNGTTEAIHNAGSLGPIANSGTINGAISSVTDLSISGGSDATFGVLTGGAITAPNLTFTGGNIALADDITAALVSNTGASVRLASEVDVSGNYDQTSGALIFRDGGKLVTGGTVNLTGGFVRAEFSSTGNYLTSDVGPTLISSTGLTYTGVTFQSALAGLGMTASVVGNDLVIAYTNDYVGGTINTYTVDPAKTVSKGLYIASSGTIVSFTNSGTIGGENFAIDNEGSIGTFNNGGTIITNGADHGFINNGTIGTFNNTGTITGSDSDIFNTGQIGTFNNSGHIGSPIGVYIAAGGSISNLVNSGVIAGTQYAIYNAGTLGTVSNSGVIDGNISSANAFTVGGASGTAKGTLTGGTITAPGVTFSSGNTLLQDNIVANGGSGTVTNSGAKLEIDAKRTITGNYTQTSGTLAIDVTNGTANYGSLVVSGAATMSGGTISLTGSGLNYGQLYTIVDATGTSSYSNLTVNAGQYVAIYSNVSNDLLVRLGFQFRQIGTAAGGDAATMGGVFETLQAGNAGFVPVIEAFANVTTADQGKILTEAAPAQVGGGAALLQRATLMTEQADSAIARHAQAKGAVWAALVGGVGERKADGTTQGYDVSSWGMVAGVDAVATDKLVLGGALSWSSGWNAGKDALAANVNGVSSFGLTGYGFWADGPLAINGRFTVGFDNYKQHRKIAMPNLTAQSSYSGRHYGMAVEAGYDFSLAGATLTPIAALKWLSLDADGYTETGAGVLSLKVGDTSARQVEGDLGVKLGWSLNTQLGELQPELRLAWAHDFVDSDVAIDAAMLGRTFATSQSRASADGLLMGAGLGLLCSGDTSLQLAYDGQFRSGYTAHSGMLRFRLAY